MLQVLIPLVCQYLATIPRAGEAASPTARKPQDVTPLPFAFPLQPVRENVKCVAIRCIVIGVPPPECSHQSGSMQYFVRMNFSKTTQLNYCRPPVPRCSTKLVVQQHPRAPAGF